VGGFAISIIYALTKAISLYTSWLTLLLAFSLITVAGVALSQETWTGTAEAERDDRIRF